MYGGVDTGFCVILNCLNAVLFQKIKNSVWVLFIYLRWNVHNITISKWTVQWDLVHSPYCATTISSVKFQNIFVTLKENLVPFKQFLPIYVLRPSTWHPPIYILSLWIYLFWIFHINVIFNVGFLSLIMFSRFIHIVAWFRTLFLFIHE